MGEKNSCCCKCCTPVVTIVVLIVFGIIIACLGAASLPFFKEFYEDTVKKQLVMKEGNEAYKNWKSPPTPVYMQFYLYNYTNYDEVVKSNSKPNVTQIGPYSYREARINAIVSLNEYNITYLQNYSYIFDPSTSCEGCSESDRFYSINTPVMTIAKKIHDLKFSKSKSPFYERWAMEAANKFLETKDDWKLFIHRSVKEILWGYTDPLLKEIGSIESVLAKIGLKLPTMSPFVALQQNGTTSALAIGNITIDTGKKNINNVQNIIEWRGLNNAPFWKTKYGGMLNGSDGSHSRPFTQRTDTVYVFTTQLCRSLYFKYLKDRTLMGISLYRFHTTDRLFQNSTANPDNYAFCDDEGCWPSGLLSVEKCQPGNPPVFMSAPHFYQGDPSLIDAIDGMHPEQSLHASFLDIEPITGITMEAHKRLQINIIAQKDDFLSILQHFPERNNTFLPVLWVHEVATVDKGSADKFKKDVLLPKTILKGASYGLLALGAFLIFVSLIYGVATKRRQKYKKFENDDPTVV